MNRKLLSFFAEEPDYKWFMFNSKLPFLKLDIKIPFSEMYSEALNISSEFIEYRESCSKGWKAVCLYGYGKEFIYDDSHYKNLKSSRGWTDIAEKCPVAVSFFKNNFGGIGLRRLRYMLLEPGGYIEPHVDIDKKILYPVNVALNHPEKCYFKMKGYGVVPFVPGAAFMLDTSNEHVVYNGDTTARIHMIAHFSFDEKEASWKEHWGELLNSSWQKQSKQLSN